MKINVITLGCSKNVVDSENLAGYYADAGHSVFFNRDTNDCDLVIVNTCGFIGDAKEESINTLLEQIEKKKHFDRRHSSDGRRRRLVAVGCLVERYRRELGDELPEIDAFYGVRDWDRILADSLTFFNDPKFDLHCKRKLSTPTYYAYLKIAEGCDRACSYCAIPSIRGRYESRPIDELVDEAKRLVADGVKELILIAQDTTYYGIDLYDRRRLGDLLERLATESGAHWIRLHYTYPTDFPPDAIAAIARHKNICNYIDIPLQHVNSRILKSMRRGIDRDGTIRLLADIRAKLPDASIRTTFIAGYPGETEAEFEELLDFVREARFDRMGCFAYSPEEGTPAYALKDDVPDEEKKRRVGELMAVQEQISLERNMSLVGRELEVVIDRREGDYYVGRTEFDSPEVDDEVLIAAEANRRLQVGRFYMARITGAYENDLIAQLC